MFEKVNPSHPDKVADRIAGAMVDLAYQLEEDPRIAVEVLIGHGMCMVINESSVSIDHAAVEQIVNRIAGGHYYVFYKPVKQDHYLAENQNKKIRCGDNGIFKGAPITKEQSDLTDIAQQIYKTYGTDGKYILDHEQLTICQSHAKTETLERRYPGAKVNPLGDWSGGPDVDAGATNRKLGSDMADSVTGGGLHGKDLSKADVSVNIYAWLRAQNLGREINISCAIGDEYIDRRPYREIVEIAREFISKIGGFEKFAEWGLIR